MPQVAHQVGHRDPLRDLKSTALGPFGSTTSGWRGLEGRGREAPRYLERSATAGSIRVARQAGPAIDTAAVIPTSTVTTANVDEVQRLHAEQHGADQPAEHRRQDQADHRAGGDDAERARHHQAQHVAGRRAERSAHAEVADPLLHRIREDAEHADHRERHRERRERRHHHRPEAVPSGGRPLDVLERDDVADADQLVLVDPRNRRPHRRRQRLGAAGLRPHHEEGVVDQIVRHRHVDLDEVLRLVRPALDLFRHADDLADVRLVLRRVGDLERDLHADRLSAAERADEGFVDDADARAVAGVAAVEGAARDNRQVDASRNTSGSPPGSWWSAAAPRAPADRRRPRRSARSRRRASHRAAARSTTPRPGRPERFGPPLRPDRRTAAASRASDSSIPADRPSW